MDIKLWVLNNFDMYTTNLQCIRSGTWKQYSEAKALIYFEPCEETYGLVGTCLIEGLSINFAPLTEPVIVPYGQYAGILSCNEPEVRPINKDRLLSLPPI